MSEYEKHSLIVQMQPELNAKGSAAVLRCGVCVLLVAVLAASGAATTSDAAAISGIAKTSDPNDRVIVHTVYAERRALMESRRLYRERRERFEKRRSGRGTTMSQVSARKAGSQKNSSNTLFY